MFLTLFIWVKAATALSKNNNFLSTHVMKFGQAALVTISKRIVWQVGEVVTLTSTQQNKNKTTNKQIQLVPPVTI